jgi:predicted Fe-Mo cluster-binding NifX family protein
VEVLICGAISRYFYSLLINVAGIDVIPWVSGSIEEVLNAYMKGNLYRQKFLMPGCCWHKGRSGFIRALPKAQKGEKGKS